MLSGYSLLLPDWTQKLIRKCFQREIPTGHHRQNHPESWNLNTLVTDLQNFLGLRTFVQSGLPAQSVQTWDPSGTKVIISSLHFPKIKSRIIIANPPFVGVKDLRGYSELEYQLLITLCQVLLIGQRIVNWKLLANQFSNGKCFYTNIVQYILSSCGPLVLVIVVGQEHTYICFFSLDHELDNFQKI